MITTPYDATWGTRKYISSPLPQRQRTKRIPVTMVHENTKAQKNTCKCITCMNDRFKPHLESHPLSPSLVYHHRTIWKNCKPETHIKLIILHYHTSHFTMSGVHVQNGYALKLEPHFKLTNLFCKCQSLSHMTCNSNHTPHVNGVLYSPGRWRSL
jgi:hypothetical protein